MKKSKSPFYVVEEFISPLLCEDVIDSLGLTVPNSDREGNPVLTLMSSDKAQEIVYDRIRQLIPSIEEHYQIAYKGTEPIAFEWFPEGSSNELHAENSTFLRNKWVRTRARDLTAVLFLSEYSENPEFDDEFEVYGGKLEFPQHGFGFNPKRGTLVVFPSVPHFINATATPMIGDLLQARIQIAAKETYLYDYTKFPGDYKTWF